MVQFYHNVGDTVVIKEKQILTKGGIIEAGTKLTIVKIVFEEDAFAVYYTKEYHGVGFIDDDFENSPILKNYNAVLNTITLVKE